MKSYKVTLHPDAEKDIRASYQWGSRTWGKSKAQEWVRELRRKITARLSTHPESCPRAPESSELPEDIRQLIVGRYRVLFTVHAKVVYVPDVRGAFVNEAEKSQLCE